MNLFSKNNIDPDCGQRLNQAIIESHQFYAITESHQFYAITESHQFYAITESHQFYSITESHQFYAITESHQFYSPPQRRHFKINIKGKRSFRPFVCGHLYPRSLQISARRITLLYEGQRLRLRTKVMDPQYISSFIC
ncbi:hypothetical protein RRG08_034971 [Elysia crispata]|uniref:Uncharacterized protein n=1 Tax=Elysia crispata TaxID=231223 RepID=A0AAE0Y305_9GAST|nr:hypothetical protein RRG08_034971 [Elysia crispata]